MDFKNQEEFVRQQFQRNAGYLRASRERLTQKLYTPAVGLRVATGTRGYIDLADSEEPGARAFCQELRRRGMRCDTVRNCNYKTKKCAWQLWVQLGEENRGADGDDPNHHAGP